MQGKRGCIEHIVALGLLTNIARRERYTLFVTFIDFSRASDMVPCDKLFVLSELIGCGMLMLAGLVM